MIRFSRELRPGRAGRSVLSLARQQLEHPLGKQPQIESTHTTGRVPFCSTTAAAQASQAHLLRPENINQNTRYLEYAVRGPLVMRSVQLRQELRQGHSKPFQSVIGANIGDCQAMNQKPLTYFRQVLACAANTKLLASPEVPADVKAKVGELLAHCDGNSVGAYTDACGIVLIRKNVAKYIEQRDGGQAKSDWNNVFLSHGASQCIKAILSFINHSRKPGQPVGVMIPIPQYPLYSASLCEYGMHQANYYLNEDNNWSLSIDELERAYEEGAARADIRAIVVINPGNPTGSVLDEQNIVEIINFAAEHKLVIVADEVYQHNIWAPGAQFHSFKRVMLEKTSHRLELASVMSASKGYMGECGLRGGFCELINFEPEVRALLYKGLSSWLCPSVLSQITMNCVVDPPNVGDDSYELYSSERKQILDDLERKAKLVAETLNSVEGVKCNQVAGAMYAFPKLQLPPRAVQEAEANGYQPDFYYVLQFLENYGVCVVPGSGFGQLPGTHHFRTTILPQPDVFEDMMDRFKRHHLDFLNKYG